MYAWKIILGVKGHGCDVGGIDRCATLALARVVNRTSLRTEAADKMHAIRVIVMVLTAWNVAEYYAKAVLPSDADYEDMAKHADENIAKLRTLLTAVDVPPASNGRSTLKPATTTINAQLNDWLEHMLRHSKRAWPNGHDDEENTAKPFAWTPQSSQYYYLEENQFRTKTTENYEETDDVMEHMKRLGLAPKISPRSENSNALVADEVDELTRGLANMEYRAPVSLIPANLRWLKILHPSIETYTEESDSTDRPRHTFLYETNASNLSDSIYSIAILIGVIAAITVSLIGLTYGLYVLSKKIRATGEPEYPAYGVTGPSDPNGDSRLAHSAHLYHYQHQKQQIIAMERGGVPEIRPGSVSEPESDEENEEGDYTVYECPGFATLRFAFYMLHVHSTIVTKQLNDLFLLLFVVFELPSNMRKTGDMEVKNPMFSDDPTPATPGKCEIVRPQPKE
ncbi:Neural proliferation differentiation and control protein 1 [Papilio xuthus]|uniref:Neural proliferation differentiation and control protein 1 n=1 Tax=Papilio xuthus TaxID=66420 RepID=A0A194PRY7_PAPXU|nr:Neural proliferation differentiation and control protein 1 [Papilio xuthus]